MFLVQIMVMSRHGGRFDRSQSMLSTLSSLELHVRLHVPYKLSLCIISIVMF